ncbi:RhoGAP domain containing protein [Entamoeba histolytica KU27]|uniref:RhoGAP domain containing protein n=1 Tax=Entamoeba histolytica KU27 TaxID=885311 RepID=M2RYP8_ENTHI|nr:RhoGAP domain containing protein [Entamoeba histolytica KU27]
MTEKCNVPSINVVNNSTQRKLPHCQYVGVYKRRKFEEKKISIITNKLKRRVLVIGTKEIDLETSILTLDLNENHIEEEDALLCFRIISNKIYILKFDNCEDYVYWMEQIADLATVCGMYGIPLKHAIKKSQWRVPLPIFRAMQYLEEHKGDEYVGIFRMSGGTVEMKKIRTQVDGEKDIDPMDFCDCVLAAAVIKDYLRLLPNPLIPYNLYEEFIELRNNHRGHQFVINLPLENQNTLWYIFSFLRRVLEQQDINKMNIVSIATCITLSISRKPPSSKISDLEHLDYAHESVQYLLENFDEIFHEITTLNEMEGMAPPSYPIIFDGLHSKSSKITSSKKQEKKNFRKSFKLPFSRNSLGINLDLCHSTDVFKCKTDRPTCYTQQVSPRSKLGEVVSTHILSLKKPPISLDFVSENSELASVTGEETKPLDERETKSIGDRVLKKKPFSSSNSPSSSSSTIQTIQTQTSSEIGQESLNEKDDQDDIRSLKKIIALKDKQILELQLQNKILQEKIYQLTSGSTTISSQRSN